MAKISGKDVWQHFRRETGQHCIQRVPPTENKGRKQTSFVCVAVLPLPPEKELKPLADKDLEITCTQGSGPGGQHRNKTASAVRMKHKPTGLLVFIDGRCQHANKREALRILSARVHEFEQANKNKAYQDHRDSRMGDGGRGDKIRTYNLAESRLVDHRNGKKSSDVKSFMKGHIEILF